MTLLKPNTAYWFWNRERKGYVAGATELHEGTPPDRNYCSIVMTDAEGKIVEFRQHGEAFEKSGE